MQYVLALKHYNENKTGHANMLTYTLTANEMGDLKLFLQFLKP